MFRRASFRLAEVAAVAPSKMQTLHKLLIGEVAFKNKGLLKQCNVEAVFGAQWQSELDVYAKTLPAADQTLLKRQVERLAITRYTVRELGAFAVNGPALIDATAQTSLVTDGVELLKKSGESEFKRVVAEEAKLANWDATKTSNFVAAVQAKAKATA